MILEKVAITIDLESDWGGRENTYKGIEEGLPFVIDLFKKYQIKATFFATGRTIEKYNSDFKKLIKEGHDVECHGLDHSRLDLMTEEEIKEEFNACRLLFEKHLGIYPKGFRAPQFRINKKVYSIMGRSGFKYDSSMNKGFSLRYKSFKKNRNYQVFKDGLYEFPVGCIPLLNLPLGLLWVNLIGMGTFKLLTNVKGLFKKDKLLVFYFHLFDLIEKKKNHKYSKLFNIWYIFKQKRAKKTLKDLIAFWKKKEKSFITLGELCD